MATSDSDNAQAAQPIKGKIISIDRDKNVVVDSAWKFLFFSGKSKLSKIPLEKIQNFENEDEARPRLDDARLHKEKVTFQPSGDGYIYINNKQLSREKKQKKTEKSKELLEKNIEGIPSGFAYEDPGNTKNPTHVLIKRTDGGDPAKIPLDDIIGNFKNNPNIRQNRLTDALGDPITLNKNRDGQYVYSNASQTVRVRAAEMAQKNEREKAQRLEEIIEGKAIRFATQPHPTDRYGGDTECLIIERANKEGIAQVPLAALEGNFRNDEHMRNRLQNAIDNNKYDTVRFEKMGDQFAYINSQQARRENKIEGQVTHIQYNHDGDPVAYRVNGKQGSEYFSLQTLADGSFNGDKEAALERLRDARTKNHTVKISDSGASYQCKSQKEFERGLTNRKVYEQLEQETDAILGESEDTPQRKNKGKMTADQAMQQLEKETDRRLRRGTSHDDSESELEEKLEIGESLPGEVFPSYETPPQATPSAPRSQQADPRRRSQGEESIEDIHTDPRRHNNGGPSRNPGRYMGLG